MVRVKPDIALAVSLVRAADQFYRAAQACDMVLEHDKPDKWWPYPQIVNYAFAAELAFKGLQALHLGKPSRGHDLEKLAETLPYAVLANVRGKELNEALFRERLHDVRDAFIDWRYAHEHEQLSISLGFLGNLAESSIAVLIADKTTAERVATMQR